MDEDGKAKIPWDINFQIDRIPVNRRLDMVTFRRDKNKYLIIDGTIPGDQLMKEREKIDKYGGLRNEIAKMWQLQETNIKFVPIAMKDLG